MNLKPEELAFWQKYADSIGGKESLRDAVVSVGYAGNPQITDELLGLFRSGKKTAGSSLVEDFLSAGDPLPQAGNYWICLDSDGKPKCILQTHEIVTNKFKDMFPISL